MTPLMGNVQNRPIHRHREWVPGGQGLGQEDGGMLMEMGFLPGAMEGSKISSSDDCTQCTNQGTACLGQMSCMVRELYLNNAVNRNSLVVSMLSLLRAWVQSLVGELRSPKSCDVAKTN